MMWLLCYNATEQFAKLEISSIVCFCSVPMSAEIATDFTMMRGFSHGSLHSLPFSPV